MKTVKSGGVYVAQAIEKVAAGPLRRPGRSKGQKEPYDLSFSATCAPKMTRYMLQGRQTMQSSEADAACKALPQQTASKTPQRFVGKESPAAAVHQQNASAFCWISKSPRVAEGFCRDGMGGNIGGFVVSVLALMIRYPNLVIWEWIKSELPVTCRTNYRSAPRN